MENDSNILDKLGNKKPFSVPANYFENFAVDIEKKISEKTEEKKPTASIPLYQKIKPYLYAAALFGAIFTVGSFLTRQTAENNAMIASVIEENECTIEEQQSELLLTYIDEDTLIDYLLENE